MLGSRLPQNDVQKMEPISTPRIAPLSNQISGALSNSAASVESTAPVPLETAPVTLNEPKEIPVTASQRKYCACTLGLPTLYSVHMQLEVIGCCIMLHIFEHTFSAKV